MLRITVDMLHGTFRGAGTDDTALTGQMAVGEWPPSPARVFQALVAGGGTRDRCSTPLGNAGLDLIEAAAPPIIHASPVHDTHSTQLLDRFAVLDKKAEGAVQNYPARGAVPVRSGARLAPAHPRLAYVWPDIAPTERELAGLRHRAARVGYLGCSDSPVRMRVDDADTDDNDGDVWRPDRTGTTTLPVPYPGYIDDLDLAFDAWRSNTARRRSWLPNRYASYRSPGQRDEPPRPQTLWLRFDVALRPRLVVAVTEALRDAVLTLYTRLVAGGDATAVPAVLHGHHPVGTVDYQHVHWLALPNVGNDHADGRIRGACIWLPSGTPTDVITGVAAAAAQLRTLRRRGVFETGVRVVNDANRIATVSSGRWTGPSTHWVSAFPVIQERRRKHGPNLDDAAAWCARFGLPSPIHMRAADVPLLRGAAMLTPHDVFRPGRERRPYCHLELRFAEQVRGPIMLGRGRQFGVGLMAPSVRAGGQSDG
jgi:CRISPR-associated protein Csb2